MRRRTLREARHGWLRSARTVAGAVALAAASVLLSSVQAARPAAVEAALPAAVQAAAIEVVQRGWNARGAFVVIDKRAAHLWLFGPEGSLRSVHDTPVLLGSAIGDDSAPGVGELPLWRIPPAWRTTPAGVFRAEHGRNLDGERVVWVDYDAAVSLHRVRAVNPAQRRLERLASPTPDDNRISYGCINVPAAFHDTVLAPALAAQRRPLIVVLPETRPATTLFETPPR
jgi:hypothetical protein